MTDEQTACLSELDREQALEWAESSGQRREISERSDLAVELRERYREYAARDMAKARKFLKLPERSRNLRRSTRPRRDQP